MPYAIESLLETYVPTPSEQAAHEEAVVLLRTHERPFDRDSLPGHITGSAIILHPDGTKVLLTHHKKLGKWIQLGGHSDGDDNTLGVAHREAWEESGLAPEDIILEHQGIWGMDAHIIPAHGDMPEHRHIDICFLFRAASEAYVVSDESLDLAWVPLEKVQEYTQSPALLRALQKLL